LPLHPSVFSGVIEVHGKNLDSGMPSISTPETVRGSAQTPRSRHNKGRRVKHSCFSF
jgi:hypothetical protein